MIEIKKQGNFIMPLTVWASLELMNEDIIDFSEMELDGNESDDFFEKDIVEQAINHWFPIIDEFMLMQNKFNNKIEYIR